MTPVETLFMKQETRNMLIQFIIDKKITNVTPVENDFLHAGNLKTYVNVVHKSQM